MKTLYLLKQFAPFLFLPIAPGLLQSELIHHGLDGPVARWVLPVTIQLVLTLLFLLIFGRLRARNAAVQRLLRMSCVSKKVLHLGKWITIEEYLRLTQGVVISHGMTPEESENWLRQARRPASGFPGPRCIKLSGRRDQTQIPGDRSTLPPGRNGEWAL